MTSLQQQLASLVGSSHDLGKLRKVSILFNEKEIQNITTQTIFSIGQNGFFELIKINPLFIPFEKTLFNQSSIQFNRQLQTKIENEKLDQEIKKFLCLLSSYILLKPAKKVFEYLIRRYNIQVYNIDAIMACILPFHATHEFSRILRILELNDTKWNFLREVQKYSEDGIGRSILIQYCLKHHNIISFIIDDTIESINLLSQDNTKLIFCSVLILEIIESSSSLHKNIISSILPFINFSIKYNKRSSVQNSCYMILSQLASKTLFSLSLLNNIFNNLFKYSSSSIPLNTLILLIHLCETQNIKEFSHDFMNDLMNINNLVSLFNDLSEKYECSSCIKLIVMFLIKNLSNDIYFNSIKDFISNYSNLNFIINDITYYIMKLYLDNKQSKDIKESINILLSLIETKYPIYFDNTLNTMFSEIKTLSTKHKKLASKQLLTLTSLNVNDIRHKPIEQSGTTLFFSLKHTSSTIRYQALSELIGLKNIHKDTINDNDKDSFIEFYSESLLDLLHDDNKDIIKLVLSAPDLIILCNTDQLYNKLINLYDTELQKNNIDILIDIIELLTNSFLKEYPSYNHKLLQFFLKRLPWIKEKSFKVQNKLLESCFNIDNILFNDLNKIKYKTNDISEHIKCNEWIINTLVSNIISSNTLLNTLCDILKDDIENNIFIRFLFSIIISKLSSKNHQKQKLLLIQYILNGLENNFKSNSIISNPELSICINNLSSNNNYNDILSSYSLYLLIINIPSTSNHLQYSQILLKSKNNNIQQLTLRLLTILIDVPSPSLISSYLKGFLSSQCGFKIFQYFSIFWMNGNNDNNNNSLLNYRKIRCLNLTNVLLYSFSQYNPSIYQYFFPLILINLISNCMEVRHAAISCCYTIQKVLENPGNIDFKSIFYSSKLDKQIYTLSFDIFKNLNEFIINNSKLLLSDSNSISNRLNDYLLTINSHNDILKYFISHINISTHPAISSCLLKIIEKSSNISYILQHCHSLLLQYNDNTIENKIEHMNNSYHIYIITQIKTILSFYNNSSISLEILNDKDIIKSLIHIMNQHSSILYCNTLGYENKYNLCLLALNHITNDYYNKLNQDNQRDIFKTLCSILQSPSLYCREKVKLIIKDLIIPSELIAEQLSLNINNKINNNNNEPVKKKQKTLESLSNNNEETISRKLESLTLLLELLQTKKNIENAKIIISHLFSLLKILTESGSLISEQIGTEYSIQLILTTLRNITNTYVLKLKQNSSLDLSNIESIYHISKIIQCITNNTSPQTHNKAFLLLASITRLFPDRVIKHAMPIFTLMGNKSIQSDDNYTFQVLHKTIQAIIPRIAEKNSSNVISIIKVLVDSFFHIPSHRRLILFGSFIKHFGMKYFNCIILLLFQIHSIKYDSLSSDLDFEDENSVPCFCYNLILQFSPLQVIPAITCIIQDLTKWKNYKQQTNQKKKLLSNSLLPLIISVCGKHSFNYYNILNITCRFIEQYLQASTFYKQYLSLSNSKHLQTSLITLFESIMFQLRLASLTQHKNNENESQKCKIIIDIIYSIIEVLNDLLQIDGFIKFISDLIYHDDPQIRRRSLLLLNEKIEDYDGDFEQYDIDKFLELVNNIISIIDKNNNDISKSVLNKNNKQNQDNDSMDIDSKTNDNNNNTNIITETSINQQTALYSLEILTRHFGKYSPDTFINILPNIINCLDNNDDQVKASAIICIATNSITIGTNILSYLPIFYPKILSILEKTLINTTNNNDNNDNNNNDDNDSKLLLIISSLSSIEVSLRNLNNFLSPYIEDTLLILLDKSLLEHSNTQVIDKINIILLLLSQKIKIRKSIESIINVYQKIITLLSVNELNTNNSKYSYISFQYLFNIFGNICKQITNSKISIHYPNIVKFFINSFDFRITFQDYFSYKHCLLVEDNIIESFISFILKLNEILFKPLFLKLKDWSCIEIQPFLGNRKAFFYKLLDKLTTSLNVVIVPMFAYLFDDIISILKHPQVLLLENKQSSTNYEFKQPLDGLCTEILISSIHSLGQCFEFNEIKFITKERFEIILEPLVNVLEYYKQSYINYDKIIPHLVYCIGQLAVTINNQLLWKPLQNSVLMHTRSESPKIRYSTLLVLQEFYSQLGEEFLPMLPESIPYIAELIEDENEKVEQLCHEIIGQIDEFLGDEKIEDYL